MVNRERDDNVYYARLAEQGERYEDMIRYMKEVAAVSTPNPATHSMPPEPHILINTQWVYPWALQAGSLAAIESQESWSSFHPRREERLNSDEFENFQLLHLKLL